MFCRSCGNELLDGAAFCPRCGRKVNAPERGSVNIANTLTADSPTMAAQVPGSASEKLVGSAAASVGVPATGVGQSSNHPYKKLGGFLAFIVYGNYVAAALMAIYPIVAIVQLFALSSQYGSYGSAVVGAAIVPLIILLVVYVALAIFLCWWATQLKNRNPAFLKIYHYFGCIALVIEFVVLIATGNAVSGFLYLILGALGLLLWTLYYMKSVRVRTYFGTDEYLRQSPFTKNVQAPDPAVAD